MRSHSGHTIVSAKRKASPTYISRLGVVYTTWGGGHNPLCTKNALPRGRARERLAVGCYGCPLPRGRPSPGLRCLGHPLRCCFPAALILPYPGRRKLRNYRRTHASRYANTPRYRAPSPSWLPGDPPQTEPDSCCARSPCPLRDTTACHLEPATTTADGLLDVAPVVHAPGIDLARRDLGVADVPGSLAQDREHLDKPANQTTCRRHLRSCECLPDSRVLVVEPDAEGVDALAPSPRPFARVPRPLCERRPLKQGPVAEDDKVGGRPSTAPAQPPFHAHAVGALRASSWRGHGVVVDDQLDGSDLTTDVRCLDAVLRRDQPTHSNRPRTRYARPSRFDWRPPAGTTNGRTRRRGRDCTGSIRAPTMPPASMPTTLPSVDQPSAPINRLPSGFPLLRW